MSKEKQIKNMSTWELANFIYNVSNNAIKITDCEEECANCDHASGWCIGKISEWLKGNK